MWKNTYLPLYTVCGTSALNTIGLYSRNGARYSLSKQWIARSCNSLFRWNEHARFIYVTNYTLFYESPENWAYYAHAQTVCTRPLLGGKGLGGWGNLSRWSLLVLAFSFFSYLQPWQFQLISKLFEGNSSALCENWRLFAPFIQEKALLLPTLVEVYDHWHITTASSCLIRVVIYVESGVA